jgi:hypothetical protein
VLHPALGDWDCNISNLYGDQCQHLQAALVCVQCARHSRPSLTNMLPCRSAHIPQGVVHAALGQSTDDDELLKMAQQFSSSGRVGKRLFPGHQCISCFFSSSSLTLTSFEAAHENANYDNFL